MTFREDLFTAIAARDRVLFADRAATEARKELGDAVRVLWPELVRQRRVGELAELLRVDRSFLYRVRDGKDWA